MAYQENESMYLSGLLDEHVPFKTNPTGMQPIIFALFVMELVQRASQLLYPVSQRMPECTNPQLIDKRFAYNHVLLSAMFPYWVPLNTA